MIRILHKLLVFCDKKNARRIRFAYIFSFLNAFAQNAPIMAGIFMIRSLMDGTADVLTCCLMAGMLLVCFALGAFFRHMSDRLQSSAGYKVFAEKRIEFARHLRKLPMGYFTDENIGRISSILTEDMVFVEENSMSVLAEIASGIFAQIVLTAFMFFLDPLLGSVTLITDIVILILSVPMNKAAARNSIGRQGAVEDLTGSVIEYAEGMAVSKSFGLMGESSTRLRDSFARSREANLQFEREYAPYERNLEIICAAGITGILAAAIWLLQAGRMDAINFIGVLLFLMNLFTPFKTVFQMGARLSIMEVALDKIGAVFAEKPLYLDGEKEPLSDYTHEIEFKDVTFSYGDEEVLKGISFTADKDQMIALVGESGSGKTTIANLMARFWDVNGGAVLLRGVNIKDMPMETLMNHISMVFQKVYLFEDTVFNNIAMGKEDASMEEVAEAARKARCYDFIMQLPYGFDTIVGEGGTSLSGGEAQRISIARCILKDAPVIILDEATASIDADNERYIKEGMTELCRDKTVLVIAHRLNTIRSADRILVIDHGQIAEEGTHDELMDKNGLYSRMALLQKDMNEELEDDAK
ncbi:MAG: ABC transporter ATP-binding protein/permease [Saccharofermentans sp.]|nr:ABC transporter ATP-binding protein/permease [Saccharofermentans sp.]